MVRSKFYNQKKNRLLYQRFEFTYQYLNRMLPNSRIEFMSKERKCSEIQRVNAVKLAAVELSLNTSDRGKERKAK